MPDPAKDAKTKTVRLPADLVDKLQDICDIPGPDGKKPSAVKIMEDLTRAHIERMYDEAMVRRREEIERYFSQKKKKGGGSR
jgi:hypothetical protein